MGFPFVSICNQLGLIVKKFLVEESRVFEVRALDNRVDWARLLTETTKNALGHVNVVLGGAARAIRSMLRLNLNCKSRTGSLAQFASDTALLTSRGICGERAHL